MPQRETHRRAGSPRSTSRFLPGAAHLLQPCVVSTVVLYLERLPGVERETKAELAEKNERFPVVHVHGGSAIRRPLMLLAVCAVGLIGYLARDFLIPTAAALVLARSEERRVRKECR